MKKVVTVAAELKLEATAELKAEVEKELAMADPSESVDLKGLCTDCQCYDRALSADEVKGLYDSTRRND